MSIYYRPGFVFTCVDPGLRGCGVAEFEGGDLLRAAYVKNPEAGRGYNAHEAMGSAVAEWISESSERIIIEHPRIYPGAQQQKGDLNDLLDVVACGASVAASFRTNYIETVFPGEWKGQVPKEMMTARISRAITDAERAKIEKCPASLMHNLLDAVGLGLWKLGRLNKKVIHQ
jgi:hypothetical protein